MNNLRYMNRLIKIKTKELPLCIIQIKICICQKKEERIVKNFLVLLALQVRQKSNFYFGNIVFSFYLI